jgi:hypothetical protein
MSESKANLVHTVKSLGAVVYRQEQDIIFLLQALMDIKNDYPDVDLPKMNNRFSERVWRQIL